MDKHAGSQTRSKRFVSCDTSCETSCGTSGDTSCEFSCETSGGTSYEASCETNCGTGCGVLWAPPVGGTPAADCEPWRFICTCISLRLFDGALADPGYVVLLPGYTLAWPGYALRVMRHMCIVIRHSVVCCLWGVPPKVASTRVQFAGGGHELPGHLPKLFLSVSAWASG